MKTAAHSPAVAAIMDAASKYTTQQILDAIRLIGGDFRIDEDRRLVRASLIELYEEREGEEAADALMDELGM